VITTGRVARHLAHRGGDRPHEFKVEHVDLAVAQPCQGDVRSLLDNQHACS
jgi:hypothetical protein